jgi:outer membrane immunogenic protein
MKKTIFAVALLAMSALPAIAADLLGGFKDSSTAPSGWAGFYVGPQLGYGWDSATTFTNPTMAADLQTGVRPAGVFGGVSADVLWQLSGVVAGVGTDINLANIADNSAVAGTSALNSTIDWFGTFHVRAGLPIGSNVLIYGTGGLAYGGVSARAVGNQTALSNDQVRFGWMAGGGGALKLSPGWIATIEYDYIDLGASTVSEVVTGIGTASATQHNSFDIIKFGLAYKLGSDYVHPLN